MEEEAREEDEGEAEGKEVYGCLLDAGGCALEALLAFTPVVLLVFFLS